MNKRGIWLDLYRNAGRSGLLGFLVALVTSPGFCAVLLYRMSVAVRRWGPVGKLLSILIWRWNISAFGCHLSPTSTCGEGLLLPHPVGIVVGQGVVIGDNVEIYQNVTFGTADFSRPDYPIIESGVKVFPGAVVVGKVTVGRGAVVGANSYVARDVPSGMVVAGSPAKVIRPVG